MTSFAPLRSLAAEPAYSSKDVMVVFGELFSRGYVNGVVDEAKKRGMKVIYSTVGRRDADRTLRPLSAEELAEKAQPLINIPLEAGFDLDLDQNGGCVADQLSGYKLSEANQVTLDWKRVAESRAAGTERFRQAVKTYLKEVAAQIPDGSNVIFVHTMAGGFPRAKIVMPVANRVFKGFGDRYASSEEFWSGELGRLCEMSFKDVTGETLHHLIDLSADLRERIQSKGGRVSYLAYGYHGTEVLVNGKYEWQSYAPYLQGWAKLRLEEIAEEAFSKGVSVSVFNAPEILTNSSSIFLGVEVSLYPLLGALRKESGSSPSARKVLERCQSLLKEGVDLDTLQVRTDAYLNHSTIRRWNGFSNWPMHNGPEQMELMRTASSELIGLHKDEDHLITAELSEVVFRGCGKVMFHEAWEPRKPVWWIGHDIIAKIASDSV